jgi:hypothetical protein
MIYMVKRIKIDTISDVKEFVARAEKFGDGLIVKGNSSACPACSLMSMLSLVDVSGGARMTFDDDLLDDVENDFAPWIMRDGE